MNTNYILNDYSAVGTKWFIYHHDDIDKDKHNKIVSITLKTINEFEKDYSRFIPSSKVSLLNKNKLLKNAGSEFIDILQICLKFNKLTDNYFNIAVGGELEKLGYKKNFTHTQSGQRSLIPNLDTLIKLKENNVYLDKNYNIDLGGIGKSYLINLLKNIYIKNGLDKFYINGGGDIYSNFEDKILLQNPINLDKYLSKITINKQGIATSSPILRSWKINNTKYHHLVNPKHLDTELNYLSCTVLSDDIIDSDIWSKSILLSNANIDVKLNNFEVYLIDIDQNIIRLD